MDPSKVSLRECAIDRPDGAEVVVGQGFFSPLTIEEIYRAVAISAPSAEFGIGMVEGSSGVVRKSGNCPALVQNAAAEALKIGAGHSFILILRGAFPSQFSNCISNLPSVVAVFCATGNPLSLILADTSLGTAVLGVVDGQQAKQIESDTDIHARRAFVRSIGYLESSDD